MYKGLILRYIWRENTTPFHFLSPIEMIEGCSATFVTNERNRHPNVDAVKIHANLYVFGKNTEGYLKMVGVNHAGSKTEIRYLGPYNNAPRFVTKERWEKGTVLSDVNYYSVDDVSMNCIGRNISK